MGFRFRRSIGIAPGVRINLGKESISTSVGVRGANVTSGTHGTRTTVGLPGTGLSYTETQAARQSSGSMWQDALNRIATVQNAFLRNTLRIGCLVLMFASKIIGGIVVGLFIAIVAGVLRGAFRGMRR